MLNWTDQQYADYQRVANVWAKDDYKSKIFGLSEALYYTDNALWNKLFMNTETNIESNPENLNNFRKALLS